MTGSDSLTRTTKRLALGLAALALTATACADVGSSKLSTDNPTGPAVICQSIRSTMETDKKAADAAKAAGNDAEAKAKMEQVIAGAQGASTVEGCDVSDIVPPSSVPALPSDQAAPSASPSATG